MHWYILIYTDICTHPDVHIKYAHISWYIRWYMHVCTLIYIDICIYVFWYTLIYAHILWYTLIYSYIHWYIAICIDARWDTLIYFDISICSPTITQLTPWKLPLPAPRIDISPNISRITTISPAMRCTDTAQLSRVGDQSSRNSLVNLSARVNTQCVRTGFVIVRAPASFSCSNLCTRVT